MAVGIELARAIEPLTFFQMKVFNAQLAISLQRPIVRKHGVTPPGYRVLWVLHSTTPG